MRSPKILRLSRELNRSIIMIRSTGEEKRLRWSPPHGTIDIWWKGGRHGALQLVLAHLLVQNSEWRRHQIRVMLGVGKDADLAKSETSIQELIEAARVKAVPVIVAATDIQAEMRHRSAEAAVVLMGFEPPDEADEEAFVEACTRRYGELPNVILVSSAGGISLTA